MWMVHGQLELIWSRDILFYYAESLGPFGENKGKSLLSFVFFSFYLLSVFLSVGSYLDVGKLRRTGRNLISD